MALPLLLGGLACSPGAVGRKVAPDLPTGQADFGERCALDTDRVTPLIVDWPAHERVDLEELMQEGVVVARYDCQRLEPLPDCRVEGAYGYMGFERKEEVLHLEDMDEVAANIPTFNAKIGASLDRGSSLDLALVLVGKRRTPLRAVTRGMVPGGDACAGATHFIRGAYVGAYAMKAGSKGHAETAASVFGAVAKAASAHAESLERGDGSTERCDAARPDSAAPIPGCGSLVRLELYAVTDNLEAGLAHAEVDAVTCPEGFVVVEGRCTRRTPDVAGYACNPDDAAQCREQCALGNAVSCGHYAFLIHHGLAGTAETISDAAPLYRRACDAGVLHACSGLGVLQSYGLGGVRRDPEGGVALHRRACDGGDARGCNNLGAAHYYALGVPLDRGRAVQLYRRACAGGFASACGNLGVSYRDGNHVKADPERARALLTQACYQGAEEHCATLGLLLETLDKPAEAQAAFDRGLARLRAECDAKLATSCANLGYYYQMGRGVEADLARANALYTRACTLESSLGCYNVGFNLREGNGDVASTLGALVKLDEACRLGSALGCAEAAALLWNDGVGDLALLRAEAACELGSGPGCTLTANILVETDRGTREAHLEHYLRACGLGDPQGCFEAQYVYEERGNEKAAARLGRLGTAALGAAEAAGMRIGPALEDQARPAAPPERADTIMKESGEDPPPSLAPKPGLAPAPARHDDIMMGY